MELKNKLDIYTKVPIKRRKQVIKWLANQHEDVILMAFEEQKNYFLNLSKVNENNKSVLYQSALYMAADHLYSLYHAQTNKNRDMDIHAVQGVTSIQAKKFKKSIQSEKRDKLMNLKNKIITLKDEEKLSFRQISALLKQHHRLTISHSYVATFYRQIKEKK